MKMIVMQDKFGNRFIVNADYITEIREFGDHYDICVLRATTVTVAPEEAQRVFAELGIIL